MVGRCVICAPSVLSPVQSPDHAKLQERWMTSLALLATVPPDPFTMLGTQYEFSLLNTELQINKWIVRRMDSQMKGTINGWLIDGQMYGWYLGTLSNGHLSIFSPFIFFLLFRESFWPCHGRSRCLLRDGDFCLGHTLWKEKANIWIPVRTHHWAHG